MEARSEVSTKGEDVQGVAKPGRRVFTAEYKRRILKAADGCATPGAVGALLRREGCTRRTWSRSVVIIIINGAWEAAGLRGGLGLAG